MYRFIAGILAWWYSHVSDYALAIALLTLVIMAVLTPLTIKGTRSMMEMQALQPEIKRLQQKHKGGDRQKLNQEMMELYQGRGVNPLSGCLPNLVQLPVFFVLFQVLRGLTNIDSAGNPAPNHISDTSDLYRDLVADKGEMVSFGIDLARSAREVVQTDFVEAIPYLVMVLFYVGLTWFQQRQMAARRTNTPQSSVTSQQQLILKWLPFVFTVFAFIFQAGLVVYFIVSSMWRIGQQAYIHRRFPSTLGEPVEAVAKDITSTQDDAIESGSGGRGVGRVAKSGADKASASSSSEKSAGSGSKKSAAAHERRAAAQRRVDAARKRRDARAGKGSGSSEGRPAPTSRTRGSTAPKSRKKRR